MFKFCFCGGFYVLLFLKFKFFVNNVVKFILNFLNIKFGGWCGGMVVFYGKVM